MHGRICCSSGGNWTGLAEGCVSDPPQSGFDTCSGLTKEKCAGTSRERLRKTGAMMGIGQIRGENARQQSHWWRTGGFN